ncbi:PREDICTED: putative late blight resistance protein homolog R1A-3 isoform X2 [Ipomoea nil]|uniref:putative late blight resistance protein homolog R1A-3 isoform X2 n=1 Tax=Ipomoea nil TaxID=35883 RepID=UPI0009008639|nr:PREDICTED: putative late blight resistance protein homolog R1A-3 isoform X2 [Ipomoea nil]
MAFLAVKSLMRTLELQFLQPQPRVTLSNKEQIKYLHEKLDHLLVYLEESEKKATNPEEMKEVTKKIKRVSVKAEDDIEAELLKAHHYHKLEKSLQRVVHDVEELMHITRNTNHFVNNNPTVGGSYQHTSDVEVAMVGHSDELDEVKSELLRHSLKQRQVMAMVGMGGIGKTTFAKRIYDDPIVTSHFELRAWTTMSQVHNKMEGDLEVQLRQSLLGQRYLIVVDDIWTTEAWDDIQRCFPDDKNGSRILLTTRHTEIAQYANNSGEYCYNMRFLNPEEGWDLFEQKFLAKEFLNNEFEVIGRNIVQKCEGLPLTIVVLAGLLSTLKSVDEWENIERTINSFLTLNLPEQFSRILNLSYNCLPSDLKGCFLYLGLFHEDCEIPIKKLIRLWIAEGFVGGMSHSKRLEEIGKDYLQDLIDRSLIMVHRRSFDGKIKTCKMHDLLHELCTSKAKVENLLYLETMGSSDRFGRFIRLGDSRWLSLKVANPAFHLVIASRKCRTILCFNMASNCDREWYLRANSFKKLRVLDLSKINFALGMPPDITDLVFLRYLALASSELLNHIPLWKNWNLQTLIISEDDNGSRKLPHGIWDLPHLRHLETYHQVSIDLPKVVQENMQTLYWLPTSECTMEVFLRIPNVKELGIIAKCEAASQGLDNLCYLENLEKLKVMGSYTRPLHLPPQANNFPQNLQKLTFVRTRIPWEAMSIISKLPHLEVLKLKNFACVGEEWELIGEGDFPKLKVLLISLTNLKEWKANVDSPFPKLQRLLLRNCFELKEMPEWIEGICNTLQLIKLEYCYASLVASAKRIKEEQLDNYGYDIEVEDSNTRPDEDHAIEEEDSNEVECVHHGLTSLWFEARRLRIEWGDDTRYWIWTRDSEFGCEVAKLEKVSWFEIRLTFDVGCLSKMTCYSAYVVFKLESGRFLDVNTGLAGVRYEKDKAIYGWMRGENRHSQVFLAKTKSYGDYGQFPNSRSDGWTEIKLGNFYVSSGKEGEVELQLWHVSDQFWKSGFIVRGIEVRPVNEG